MLPALLLLLLPAMPPLPEIERDDWKGSVERELVVENLHGDVRLRTAEPGAPVEIVGMFQRTPGALPRLVYDGHR